MSDAVALAAALEDTLRAAGTPERAAQEKRYLKSSLEHLGATVPVVRRAARALLRTQPLDRAGLLALVEALWARPVHECRAAAVELLEADRAVLEARDLALLERLLRESRTWALVDNLAASVVGPLVERFPRLGRALDRWARDEDFWIRRASLLADLVALREGRGDFARFARHADAMLQEEELFVRKAIGWVLRDFSRRDPARVAAFLRPRAARAAGLTLREAVKYLPPRVRAEILAARDGGPVRPRRRARPAFATTGGRSRPAIRGRPAR